IIASNEVILSADYTSGLARRRITIPFLHQPATRRNLLALHGETMTGDLVDELPGVLRWALGLSTEQMEALLLDTTTHVPSLAVAAKTNLVRVNPLAQWADECLLYDPKPDATGTLPKTYVGVARRVQLREAPATYENADTWLYANYRDFAEAVGN